MRVLGLGLSLLLLFACGKEEAPPPPAEPAKPGKTVFDDQIKAMDKARDLAKEETERLRRMDESLNESDDNEQ